MSAPFLTKAFAAEMSALDDSYLPWTVDLVVALPYTCARYGAVRCWGGNTDGRLGYRNRRSIGDDETPASVENGIAAFGGPNGGDVPLGGPVEVGAFTLALADAGKCLMTSDFEVLCWGRQDQIPPEDQGPIVLGSP